MAWDLGKGIKPGSTFQYSKVNMHPGNTKSCVQFSLVKIWMVSLTWDFFKTTVLHSNGKKRFSQNNRIFCEKEITSFSQFNSQCLFSEKFMEQKEIMPLLYSSWCKTRLANCDTPWGSAPIQSCTRSSHHRSSCGQVLSKGRVLYHQEDESEAPAKDEAECEPAGRVCGAVMRWELQEGEHIHTSVQPAWEISGSLLS